MNIILLQLMMMIQNISFLSQDENFPNILLWYDNTGCYMIEGDILKEELFKMQKKYIKQFIIFLYVLKSYKAKENL